MFLAQVTPASEAVDQFNEWWLIVAAVFPFVFPYIVKAGAARWVKLVLSLGLSFVAALVTLLPQLPEGGFSTEAYMEWAFMFIGVVQAVYQVADNVVENAALDEGRALNRLDFYRPDQGLGKDMTPVGPGR